MSEPAASASPSSPPDGLPPEDRHIQVAHRLPGRTRFRLPWLRRELALATRLADALARQPGVRQVDVRPYTGAVLCHHDRGESRAERLLETIAEVTGVKTVVGEGEAPPVPRTAGLLTKGVVARELATLFDELDDQMLRTTDGHIDLGTLVTAMFVGAGAMQVLVRKEIPAPPWFTLGWWGFRTFLTFERDAHRQPPPQGAQHPSAPAATARP